MKHSGPSMAKQQTQHCSYCHVNCLLMPGPFPPCAVMDPSIHVHLATLLSDGCRIFCTRRCCLHCSHPSWPTTTTTTPLALLPLLPLPSACTPLHTIQQPQAALRWQLRFILPSAMCPFSALLKTLTLDLAISHLVPCSCISTLNMAPWHLRTNLRRTARPYRNPGTSTIPLKTCRRKLQTFSALPLSATMCPLLTSQSLCSRKWSLKHPSPHNYIWKRGDPSNAVVGDIGRNWSTYILCSLTLLY